MSCAAANCLRCVFPWLWRSPSPRERTDYHLSAEKVSSTVESLLNDHYSSPNNNNSISGSPTSTIVAQRKSQDQAPGVGFFYEIQDSEGKVRGYLNGVIHISYHLTLNAKMQAAYGKSQYLFFELNSYDNILKDAGIDPSSNEIPIATSFTIQVMENLSTDLEMIAKYRRDPSKIICELEDRGTQQKLLEISKKEPVSNLKLTVEAWKKGSIDEILKQAPPSPNPQIFGNRTLEMGSKMLTHLKNTPESLTTFSVGTLLLFDLPDLNSNSNSAHIGLINILESNGYKLIRVFP